MARSDIGQSVEPVRSDIYAEMLNFTFRDMPETGTLLPQQQLKKGIGITHEVVPSHPYF